MQRTRRQLISNMLWIGAIVFTLTALATWNSPCRRNLPLALTAFGVGIFTIAATLASVGGGGAQRKAVWIVLGVLVGVALFFIFFYHWVDSCTA